MIRINNINSFTIRFIVFILVILLLAYGTFLFLNQKGIKEEDSTSNDRISIAQSISENKENISEFTKSKSEMNDTEPDNNMKRAEFLYELILKNFRVPNTNYLKYYVPSKPEEKEMAFMWPYLQAHAMANSMLELDGRNTAYKENLLKIIEGLENYKSFFNEKTCYHSYPTEFGGGDTFYDDNIWVAIELFRSSKLLNDNTLLITAEDIFEYVICGWNDSTGGLYWKEANCNIMTACTNAPTAILGVKLYAETGKKSYLDWSAKIYDWVKSHLLSEKGVFWDHLIENGNIEKTTWTYNTGMMISAAVGLYEASGDVKYIKDARYYAKSAYSWFLKNDSAKGLSLYPDTPWFNLLLFQGYIDLYKIDGDNIYIDSIKANLDYAWDNSRDPDGYIYPGLYEGIIQSYKYHSLLDQASFAESYALMALLEKEIR